MSSFKKCKNDAAAALKQKQTKKIIEIKYLPYIRAKKKALKR